MKRAIKAILLLLWMALIFGLSGQPAELSDELSEISTGRIAGLLSFILRNVDVKTIASFLMEYIAYIRKAAHVFEYMVLGILASMNGDEYLRDRVLSTSLIFCFMYALSDEFHQLYILGRAGSMTDVLIDTCGAAIGVFLYHQFMKKWKRN